MAKLEVMYGVFFLSTLGLQICSSAVICPPCGPGEYCSIFFGGCLSCADYCRDGDVCPKECSHNKLSTTIPPTPSPNRTTFHHLTSTASTEASALLVTYPDISWQSGGEEKGFLSKDYLELPLELLISLLFICILFMLAGWLGLHRKTLKMSINRCFKARDSQTSTYIELHEIQRNRRRSSGTTVNIWPNPMENSTHVRPLTVEADQVADEVSTSVLNQPGPSGLNSFRSPRNRTVEARPANSEHSVPGFQRTPAPVDVHVVHHFQSASIQSNNASPWEHEKLLGAVPSDYHSGKQKTPETHRKITDGTHEGHLCVPGASPFIPAPFEHEWNRDSDGD